MKAYEVVGNSIWEAGSAGRLVMKLGMSGRWIPGKDLDPASAEAEMAAVPFKLKRQAVLNMRKAMR
jgi:hypothetical protein